MENEVIDPPAPPALAPANKATLDALDDYPAPGNAPAQQPAPASHLTTPPWNPDARGQQRLRIYGRASLTLPDGKVLPGSIFDMSPHGVSVLLDCRVAMHQSYTLQLYLYRNGKLHILRLPAISIHETLLGCKGFKHGFQFGAHSDAINQALAEILA